mmetsp:Transcript_7942/g.20170  ORF Transcript_7942/g.20170 Transcript_7942/m.20170 type:complete len:232 (-) Transcript_7942:358-1053(-)
MAGEGKICPVTGAVGYCPMAKPRGYKADDPKPELKVMFLLIWEEGKSKVSIGVYPHMNKHWEALEIPDTSSKDEIKAQYRKLSMQYHPDKNKDAGAKERFQAINDAYEALKDVDGSLAFPWEQNQAKQRTMSGMELLKTFGYLGKEAAGSDPIKAQMMQHVVKEATECKVLVHDEEDQICGGEHVKVTQADALCVDTRNGSNHLVKVYRRITAADAKEQTAPPESDRKVSL